MRRLLAPVLLVLLCWGLGGLRPVEAQVVIRERVEVRPPEASGRTSDRLIGHWVYYPWRNPNEPAYTVGSTSATIAGTLEVTTSEDEHYSTSIASGFEATGESNDWGNCNSTPYYRRYHYTLGEVELLRVPIYEGESITAQTVHVGADSLTSLGTEFSGRLACPLTYNDCGCFGLVSGPLKSTYVGFRRVWEPEPPDHFAVAIQNGPLTPNQSAIISVVAQWADSTEAPLWEGTPTTITASNTSYGYLQAGVQAGASLALPYRSNNSASAGYFTYYYDQNVPRPVCDVPVEIGASGGGLSGSATLILRGSSTATAADTLIVSAEPAILAHGDTTIIHVQELTEDGCVASSGLASDSVLVDISISPGSYGELRFGNAGGSSLSGIQLGHVRSGLVSFIANGQNPIYTSEVIVSVSGVSVDGKGRLLVLGGGGANMCPIDTLESRDIQIYNRTLSCDIHNIESCQAPEIELQELACLPVPELADILASEEWEVIEEEEAEDLKESISALWTGMNEAERRVCLRYPSSCGIMAAEALMSFAFAYIHYGANHPNEGRLNNPNDALRHARWASGMYRSFSMVNTNIVCLYTDGCARRRVMLFLEAHETPDPGGWNLPEEMRMDWHNNFAGLSIIEDNGPFLTSVDHYVLDMWYAGGLQEWACPNHPADRIRGCITNAPEP